MSSMTTHVGLVKPAEAELADVGVLNSNYDTIDTELYKRGKTVNGIEPDSDGDFKVNEVQFAHEIVSQNAEESSAEYILRTTGGSASINDGDAKVISILGRSLHTGKVNEVLTLTVVAETREADPQTGEVPPDITASINRDTFVAYVDESGTITLTYTNAWSANPALYGVTVSGTPVSGDQIIIVYVKAARGTITNSNPTSFVSTGWNLYNHTNTYARVLKYSATYGFLAGGTYTKLEFSASLTGEKTEITPVAGYFTIPSDGFVWVTGGNSTDTYIVMTWSDWTSGPEGSFAAYTESTINLATVMSTYFPYGMMQVGAYADEINFSMDTVFSRIERMSYSAENLAAAEATGRPYDCDENYIYIVKEVATKTENAGLDGHFTANDHGMEYIGGTTVPVFVQTLYGENLVEKLRTDIPNAISELQNKLNTKENYYNAGTPTATSLEQAMAVSLKAAYDAGLLNDSRESTVIIFAYNSILWSINALNNSGTFYFTANTYNRAVIGYSGSNSAQATIEDFVLNSNMPKVGTVTVSITTGYFIIRGYPNGKKMFITNKYVSGAPSENLTLIFNVQPDEPNNRYIVYVRKSDGSVPSDRDITIDLLVV